MRLTTVIAAATLFASALPVPAHEFWISPETYMIGPEDQLVAEIRVGQQFVGAGYAYIPARFERFDLVWNGEVHPVDGRIGDRPALNVPAPGDGLVVAVHQTTDYLLTYSEWDLFVNFVAHKDFAWAIDEHRAKGYPETEFSERYSRYAKSLIAVGDGAGSDREVGLLIEIVAEANPYTDDVSGGLPVRVLYEGAPRGDAQVELFERATDGSVDVTLHRTDADGRAVLPVKPGHEYLVDHVVMRALEPAAEGDPVWESLWASLTFQVPPE